VREAVSEVFNQQFAPRTDRTAQWLAGEELDGQIRHALRETIRRFLLEHPEKNPSGEIQARIAKKILDTRKIGSKKVRVRDRIREIALEEGVRRVPGTSRRAQSEKLAFLLSRRNI
jgi:hypothetical protein